eukprot:7386987-Prymnesium_polylepis.1
MARGSSISTNSVRCGRSRSMQLTRPRRRAACGAPRATSAAASPTAPGLLAGARRAAPAAVARGCAARAHAQRVPVDAAPPWRPLVEADDRAAGQRRPRDGQPARRRLRQRAGSDRRRGALPLTQSPAPAGRVGGAARRPRRRRAQRPGAR